MSDSMAVVFGVPQISTDSLTTFLREDRTAGQVLAGCLIEDVDTLVDRGEANLSITERHEHKLKLLPLRDRKEKAIQNLLLHPTPANVQLCAAHVGGSHLIEVANAFIAPQKVRIIGGIVNGKIIPKELSTNLKSLSPVRVIIDEEQSLSEVFDQVGMQVKKYAPDAAAFKLYLDDHRHLSGRKKVDGHPAHGSTAKPYELMALDPELQG
jgi:hypothetical protein